MKHTLHASSTASVLLSRPGSNSGLQPSQAANSRQHLQCSTLPVQCITLPVQCITLLVQCSMLPVQCITRLAQRSTRTRLVYRSTLPVHPSSQVQSKWQTKSLHDSAQM